MSHIHLYPSFDLCNHRCVGETVSMTDLRCATVTAAMSVAPAGSATWAHRFVLVELPLPWPKPIAAHPLLATVDIGAVPGVRVLAIAGETDATAEHQVITYDAVGAPATPDDRVVDFDGYRWSETTVSTAGLAGHVAEMINAPKSARTSAGEHVSEPRDLLICTQGTHDRCCGSMGTELYRSLLGTNIGDLRIWRTSHTGGHRFAPTGISFPDGLMWAGLDASSVSGIADRSIDSTLLAPLLRGCSAMKSPAAQAADVAMLVDQGWRWLEGPRSIQPADGDELSDDEPLGDQGTNIAQLRLTGPDRSGTGTCSMTAIVEQGPRRPVPPCGQEIELATKSSSEWLVTSLSD